MSPGTGHSRARYRGPLGATRREHVHYACACGALHSVEVVVSVDSQSDPLLARRMRDGDGSFNTTVCPDTRVRARVEVPVVYHDPLHRLFALVLPEGARTRELRERAALLLRLADDTAHAVPPYVLDFAVAYGAAGLRRCVEAATDRALSRRAASVSDRELTPAPAFESAAPRPLSAPNGSGAVRQASESGAVRSASAPANESGAVRSVTGAANESGAVRSVTGAANESGAVRSVTGAAANESGPVRSVAGAAANESGAVRSFLRGPGSESGAARSVTAAAASESGAVRSFLRGPESESGPARTVTGASTTESSVMAPLPTPPRSESSVMAPLPAPPRSESSVMAPLPVPPATESGAATPAPTSPARESGDERPPGPPPAIWQAPSPPASGSAAAPPEPGLSRASEDEPPPWIGPTAAPVLPDSPAIGSDEPRSQLPEPPTRPMSSSSPSEPQLPEPPTPPMSSPSPSEPPTRPMSSSSLSEPQPSEPPMRAMPSPSLSEPQPPEPPTRPMSSPSPSEPSPSAPSLAEPPPESSTANQSPTRSRVPTSPLPAPPPSREPATHAQPATGSGAATPSASPSSRPSAVESSPVAAPLGPVPAAGTESAPPLAELVDADPDGDTTSPIRGLETVVTPPPAGAEAQPDETWPYRRADADCGVGDDGLVHLSVRAAGRELAMLSSPDLGVRLQLHRMPSFPIVTIALGSAGALAGEADAGPPRWVALHIGHEPDVAVLRALARSFEIELQALDIDAADAPPVARARLAPPLAENASAVLAGALDYLKGIPPERRSFSRALSAFEAADHDCLGTGSSHAAGLHEAVLDALESPDEVLRACALVKRFSQPTGEDWLIMTRSYPLPRWQSKRRAAVSRAVELGIWPGPVGAQIAVADGLARSRKNLVLVLQRHFAATLSRPTHGLDEAAVRDNWKALKAEARALGLPVSDWTQPRRPPIMSESEPVTSGTIGDPASTSHSDLLPALGTSQIIIAPSEEAAAATSAGMGAGDWTGLKGRPGRPATARRGDLAHLELAELLVRLRIRERRHAAAVELCRRGEIAAMELVFRSVELMTRGEASRVLATAIQFGRGAEPHFLAGLKSRKAFVRQGAAFALAVTRGEAGVEAVCDLLLDEPTEMWREIARALGEAGSAAVMPLAARLGERTDQVRERAAWALAHVAARGARRPIETLAAGRDPVAAGVARRAVELIEQASGDDLESRNEKLPRDQALNRAFSRRFLDTLRAERRAIAEAAARGAADTTSPPPVLLEAADLASPARDEDGEDAPDDADEAGAAIGAEASGARGSDRAPS